MASFYLVSVLAIAGFAQANSALTAPRAPTTCSGSPVLSSDGTATGQDFLPMASTNYYTLNVLGGHSYSIEVWDPFDPTNGLSPALEILREDCAATVNTSNMSSMDPDLTGGFSARVSWIQGSDATLHLAVSNPDQNNSYTYFARVTDTTLFNPRWTTYSGFATQWGLTNTTGTDLVGNFSVVNADGTLLKTVIHASIKAGVTTFFYSGTLGLPADHVGSATFAYIGAPGAILADAYYLNANATVVVPSIFVSKRAHQ